MPDKLSSDRDLMKGYYESYRKWNVDAGTERTKSLSSAKANLAVAGVGSDSPIYQATMSRLTQEFESNVASIEAGQTKESLSRYFESSKNTYSEFLNREGVYSTTGARNTQRTPSEYAGATQEEINLVSALDRGAPKDVASNRPGYLKNQERKAEYQGLLDKREELIGARQDQSFTDYYESQFPFQEETGQVSKNNTTSNYTRQRAASGATGQSPWW